MRGVCQTCGDVAATTDRYCRSCGLDLQDESGPSGTDNLTGDLPDPGHSRPTYQRRKIIVLVAAICTISGALGACTALLMHRSDPEVVGKQRQELRQLDTGEPTVPANTELSELRQITPEVQQSALARKAIESAVNGVGSCRLKPAQGISTLGSAINRREVAVNRTEKLPVNTIPNGVTLRSDLLQVLRESSDADNAFIGWMHDNANSSTCPVSTTGPAYQAGYRASQRAVTAKNQFLKLWNPLAEAFTQPTFTANGI